MPSSRTRMIIFDPDGRLMAGKLNWLPLRFDDPAGIGSTIDPGPPGNAAVEAAVALTRQERQVAGIVGRGATNREAAEQLFLSPRTIDFHLRNIYEKLGVRSRTKLALHVAAQEPRHRRVHKSLDAHPRSWSDNPSDVIHAYRQAAVSRTPDPPRRSPQGQKGQTDTMERTYAPGAMDMAAVSRSRVRAMGNGSCSPVAFWSPIALGTTQKHGQPRRTQASP